MSKRPQKSGPGYTAPSVRIEHCVELHRAGRLDAALACYATVPIDHPAHADALHLSGVIVSQRGDPARGAEMIGRALALSPTAPIFHVNHANALEALGDLTGAEQALRQAIGLAPDLVPALYNLGKLLAVQGRLDESIGLFDRALVADPSHLDACLGLGNVLLKKEMIPLAWRIAQKAISIAPEDIRASDLLIATQFAGDRYADAATELAHRLEKEPANFALLQGRGHALAKSGALSEAVSTYRAALAVSPGHRDVTIEMALLRVQMGEPETAIVELSALCERSPDPMTFSNLLFQLNYDDALPVDYVAEQHRKWEPQVRLARPAFVHGPPTRRPRIRVGYVSSDFKQHSVSWFIENVLAAHHRDRFEVFAYFVDPDPDSVTERIRGTVDCFRDSRTQAVHEIAEQIRADGIDIAIELAGHTSFKVLEIMLYRPAPVQISWLGYPNTSGLSTIDYRISDAVADPPGENDARYIEKLLRLPDCFHCYRPNAGIGYDSQPPLLRNGFVTFGSFNLLPKISPACCEHWARIINGVPGSRLLLKNRALHDPAVRENLLARFEAAGLGASRIKLMGDMTSWPDHMACYRHVDIALDPFPYNGTTTTCEALWMGVPVLTVAGDRHASRVGASLLTAIGHPELIAPDRERYVTNAIALASDAGRLAELHHRMHDEFLASPLCDVARFTRSLEAAYDEVWQRYLAAHH